MREPIGMNSDLSSLLPKFGLSEFRPGQRDVVDSLSAGKDVMCVMPTGGGKSLCYQLPSLAREGMTIVVSPLIALMKDQVDSLQALGINAKLINSSLSASEQNEVMREAATGTIDLLYVAPERLRNGRFLEAISSAKVSLLAVDEAHCVSEWGHDFRPDYSRLGQFREKYLHGVQTIALTATATPTVREDVCHLLGLKSPATIVTGFARTNLRFNVIQAQKDRDKDENLVNYLKKQDGAGIIYAATRKACEEIGQWLPEKTRRSIGVYHGGMDAIDRKRVQEAFMAGELSAIVATNAFGMGIDKSDIRFVAHYNMPGSLEAYYQEAGRAGRDGQESDCLLLFAYSDRYIQEFFIDNRYPSKETVRKVYEFLLTRNEDPIEMTQEQVRSAIQVKDGNESIGTAQSLLVKAGVLKRLDNSSNSAVIRIDTDAPTLLDFLPREAKLRKRVVQAVERVIGNRRYEDIYVPIKRLMELAQADRTQLTRTLRELSKLRSFDYVPPFRGRALHFLQRDVPFAHLDIDFDELDRRKKAEHEKLEAVIGFARTSGCRQRVILNYFGDPNSCDCGKCDRCDAAGAAKVKTGDQVSLNSELKGVDSSALLCGIRVVLSGVTRMHGRFGKTLVAQMLCGSKNKKLRQWKLNRLSTYGMLSALRQAEIVSVMDSLIEAGLLEQREVDERRPTVQISEKGKRVMHSQDPLPDSVQMTFPLAKRLAIAARDIESGDVQSSPAVDGEESTSDKSDGKAEQDDAAMVTEAIAERLKSWRRKTSAALGIPAYRVLSNATIDRIAELVPTNSEQLESVSGVGPATMEQFGYDVLELVRETSQATTDEISKEASANDTETTSEDTSPARQEPTADEEPTVDEDPDDGDLPVSSQADPSGPDDDLSSQASVQSKSQAAQDSAPKSYTEDDPSQNNDKVQEAELRVDAANSEIPAPHKRPIEQEKKRQQESDVPTGPVSDCYWTWRLFKDGYSIDQIAQIRGRSIGGLIQDLAQASAAGYKVEPHWKPKLQ